MMTGAFRFTGSHQCVCVCVVCVHRWCKQTRMAAFLSLAVLFGRSRSGWNPSTVRRVLYASMCYSHYRHTAQLDTAKAQTPRRERAEWLHSRLIIQASSHAWTECFNFIRNGTPPLVPSPALHALAAAGFSRMNQAPVQDNTSGVINRMEMEGGQSFEVTSLLLPNRDCWGLLNR